MWLFKEIIGLKCYENRDFNVINRVPHYYTIYKSQFFNQCINNRCTFMGINPHQHIKWALYHWVTFHNTKIKNEAKVWGMPGAWYAFH